MENLQDMSYSALVKAANMLSKALNGHVVGTAAWNTDMGQYKLILQRIAEVKETLKQAA